LIALHILPNVLPIIIVMAALRTSDTLLLDAALSFLGLGVPPPTPSWGPHDRRGDDLLPYRTVAGDFSRSRDLLRGTQLQSFRLRIFAQALPIVMMLRKIIPALIVIAIVAGCGGGPPPLNLPPHAMVLRLADADDVPTLDPAAGYDTVSWTFEQAIFDTLVRYGDGNIELEPDIAITWESSPDATTFTFHLAGRCALFRRTACDQRRLPLWNRTRAESRHALPRDGVLPGHRRRRRLRRASYCAR